MADLPPAERERYYNQHAVTADTRTAVERLVKFDRGSDKVIGEPLANIAAKIERNVPATAASHAGPYKLLREIGRGGMGAVYEAERADGAYRGRVAIKFVSRAVRSDFVVDRFLRERQILADLDHANICRLMDAGTTADGSPYLVMQLIEGQSIDEWSKSRTPHEICALFRQVCEAVHHAHMKNVVHRDLKPGNILVSAEGQPKLLDFGIAKLLDGAPVDLQNTIRAMTPDYASPEQIAGQPVTAASDIYGLGCVLYQLLTGKTPARSTTQPMPTVASKVNQKLDAKLDAILQRAMQPDPRQRYGSAREFGDEIGRWLTAPPPPPSPSRAVPVLVGAAVILGLTAGWGWWRATTASARLATVERALREANLSAPASALRQQWATFEANQVDDPLTALSIARGLRRAGDPQTAMAVAGKIAGEDSLVELEKATLASEIDLDGGRLDEAAAKARRALQLAGEVSSREPVTAAEAATQAAIAEQQLGRMAEARAAIEKALAWLPQDPKATRARAVALDRQSQILEDAGDLTQALKVAEAAAKLEPKQAAYRRRVGEVLEASGERERARRIYDEVYAETKDAPVSADVLLGRMRYAGALRWLGRNAEAEQVLEGAAQAARSLATGGDRRVRLALGRILAAKGDHGPADARFLQLLGDSPHDAEVLREFAANRLSMIRSMPAAQAAPLCGDVLTRLTGTPHPAVAVLLRQLQISCGEKR